MENNKNNPPHFELLMQYIARIEVMTNNRIPDEQKRLLAHVFYSGYRTGHNDVVKDTCDWMRTHLPRVLKTYYIDGKEKKNVLNEDMRDDYEKAMVVNTHIANM